VETAALELAQGPTLAQERALMLPQRQQQQGFQQRRWQQSMLPMQLMLVGP